VAYDCALNNCIVYYNVARQSGANYSGGVLNYSCTIPLPPGGVGNISVEPRLASVSHLSAGSPCRGAGSASFVSGLDIDGEVWANPPSIGCDEYRVGADTGLLTVAITASYTNVAIGFVVNFRAQIVGKVSTSHWEYGDGTVVSNQPYASHSWAAAGDYRVVLRAYNETYPQGVSATVVVHVVEPPVHYVDLNSSSPVAPYGSWATAARNIQDAVGAATVAGALAIVSNGVYQTGGRAVYGTMTNRVAVTKPLSVRSVNGPDVTAIWGYQVPGTKIGDAAVRCVYLTDGAALMGFTLINGATQLYENGGGVWCESASTVVSNCTLTGNSAGRNGGGAYGGTLKNCTLMRNRAEEGGGSHSSILSNCLITCNAASYGGGAMRCVLTGCTLADNDAGDRDGCNYGGGAAYCTLNNCIIYYNSCDNYAYSILNYCCTDLVPTNGVGNITNEPGFIDPDSANYRLALNSPCINAGNNSYAPTGFDLDGHARIVGATVDLGAYEFQEPYMVDATVTEGNAGTTSAVFIVRLAINHSEIISVDFTTADGSATPGSDYLATSGTLIFSPGETNKTIVVPVLGDILDEASETFFVRLSNPTNISLINTQAVGTIINDDTVQLSIAGATVLEGNIGTTSAVFALHLDHPHVLPVSVNFATADGSAVAGADYIATSGTVTFAPGETNQSVAVLVNGDTEDETNETFLVNLSNPFHAVLTSAQAIGTILDDDAVPLSITGATVLEGNIGTTDAVFALHLARPHVLPVSVDFATADGSTVAGADYIAASGTITFAPGETNKNITVLVIGDFIRETDEMFTLNLSHPVHATLVATQASGTILNDDTVRLYVNVNNPNPAAPYTNWATAAVTIQNASDAAADGDEIVVTNGIYATGGRVVYEAMMNRLAATKRLTVRSVNGPGVTAISGGGAVRCVYLTNGATLVGFTLTNGFAATGGGVWCESVSVMLSNCTLVGNSASIFGGGSYSGTLNDCTLMGNSAYYDGGGAYRATLNNCTLAGNSQIQDCGATAGGTLHNCTLTGNSSYEGGGAEGGTLNNCILTGNSASYVGGGACFATLKNCILVSNSAAYGGGGASGGSAINCTLKGNTAGAGGGTLGCNATDCTFAANSSIKQGGGALFGTLNNCILYYNTAADGANYSTDPRGWVGGAPTILNYCDTSPLPTNGVGNFTNEPIFIDLAAGNLRLNSNSPCINAGLNNYALAGPDLDGNSRIAGGTVDVGAYEFQSPQSAISYAWLQQYGLPTNGSADGADPDGDRLNNYQEWRTGTAPTNALSVLRLKPPLLAGSNLVVTWESVQGRSYFLGHSTNLASPASFHPVAANIPGQAGTTTYTHTNAAGAGFYFYRVGVE
jgi:hypothetical protein